MNYSIHTLVFIGYNLERIRAYLHRGYISSAICAGVTVKPPAHQGSHSLFQREARVYTIYHLRSRLPRMFSFKLSALIPPSLLKQCKQPRALSKGMFVFAQVGQEGSATDNNVWVHSQSRIVVTAYMCYRWQRENRLGNHIKQNFTWQRRDNPTEIPFAMNQD